MHEGRRHALAYTKRSETIRDLLAALGAHGAELRHEEEAVLRWARERANRLTNADAANLRRQADAAARQRAAIEALGGPDELPTALRIAAELRLEHPDATLAELATALSSPPLLARRDREPPAPDRRACPLRPVFPPPNDFATSLAFRRSRGLH